MVIFILCIPQNLSAAIPSFDCNKARLPAEKQICSDKELAFLDDLVGKRYKEVLKIVNGDEHIIGKQRHWLKNRNACQERKCIKDAYVMQFEVLGEILRKTQAFCEKIKRVTGSDSCKASRELPNQFCMDGAPTSSYLKKVCTEEDSQYVKQRSRIVYGDKAFCQTIKEDKYILINLNLPHSVNQDETWKEIAPWAGYFDINNDGKGEYLTRLSSHSGAGRGCDIEHFVEIDKDRRKILNTRLTRILSDTGHNCRTYHRALKFRGKVYIENRRTVKLREKGNNFVEPISEVIELIGDTQKILCKFSYKE